MSEIIIALQGGLCACLAVVSYRLGLRDGMRREQGLPPTLAPAKHRNPTDAEVKAQKTAQAVENFR